MKIKLCFPDVGIQAIKALGLRQRNPETLRWTADHQSSSYGIGVLLRGKSGEILDGKSFAGMHHAFGAWIEVDSADTKQRVENALVTAATELDDQIKVVAKEPNLVGRPPLRNAKRHNIIAKDEDWNLLVTLGNGNASEGIREALEFYRKAHRDAAS